jgi:nicotinamide mononucleotide adenylyltransferase
MRLFELSQPLTENKADTVVFTFGRFNPPTVGHEKLVRRVQGVAQNADAEHVIFLSQTQKKGKDPLSWKDKIKLFQKMFPDATVSTDASAKTPFMALEALGKKYDNVIMVVGSDRVEQFRNDMSKYTKEYGIEKFDVVSAGQRDPDAEGVEGMSASKARQLAAENNFDLFAQALPNSINNATKKVVFNKIRKNM